MKPLALFGVIVVVGLVAIGAALHLTNNSASAKLPPLSPASEQALFVREGNGACARFYKALFTALEGRGKPKNAKTWARYLRMTIPLFVRMDAELRTLVPPRRDAGTYRRLLRISRREIREARAVQHALETGQVRRARRIGRGEHLDRRANSLSRKIGLTICGLNGHQMSQRYG